MSYLHNSVNPCQEIQLPNRFNIRKWYIDYNHFLMDNSKHLKILSLARSGEITVKYYGKLLTMLWSEDTEMTELAITLIEKL